MKFGIFYELQLPRPWGPDDERRLVQDALAQVELADRLGLDYAWAVEHHFLEEYSHCSASEVFLAAAAARTKRIRLGHGIRQVIANYNHPARTAEAVAMLDLVSNGRAELGIGEGDVVSWQLPTWLESLVIVGALARLGAVQNPILPICRAREVGFMVRQTGAQFLVVPGEWRGFDYLAMAEDLGPRPT